MAEVISFIHPLQRLCNKYSTYENVLTQNSNAFFSQNSMNYYNGGIFRNMLQQVAAFKPHLTNTINFSSNNMCSQILPVETKHDEHDFINQNDDNLDIAEI